MFDYVMNCNKCVNHSYVRRFVSGKISFDLTKLQCKLYVKVSI